MRKDILLVGVATLLGMAFLIHLGNWQWDRLKWKNNLTALIHQRVKAPPANLEKLTTGLKKHGADWQRLEYLKIKVRGHFLNKYEHYLFAITNSKPGWHVFTPFKMTNGDVLLVNRGWVSEAYKSPSTRQSGFIKNNVEITGLVRVPPSKKPNPFVASNDPVKNIYYWRSLADMKQAGPPEERSHYLPVMLDMEPVAGVKTGDWPKAGTTVTNPSNRHLGYIITWYGLAFALFLVSAFYIRSRLKTA